MNCLVCKEPLTQEKIRRRAKYCSLKCQKAAQFGRFYEQTGAPRKNEVATATTGAMHELLVCADLMRKGYHVFRAQSPSCPCDIMAMFEGIIYKVEVTTGYKRTDGNFSYPKKNERYDYDIMAIVFHDGDVIYLQSSIAVVPPNIACSGLVTPLTKLASSVQPASRR